MVIVLTQNSATNEEIMHIQSVYCGKCKGYDINGNRHVLEESEVPHSFPKEATCTTDSEPCICRYVQKKLGHKVPEVKYDYINVNRHRKKYICERCGENLTSMFILEPHTLETVGNYAQEGTGILMKKVECTVCKGSWDYACTDPETGKYIYSNGSGGRKRKWRSEAEAGGGSRTEVAVGSGSSSRHR